MLTPLLKNVQQICLQNFLIEDFFYLSLVLTTQVVNLKLQISPQIKKKIEPVLMGYSGAGGYRIHEKT
jgi:hypothetical protein